MIDGQTDGRTDRVNLSERGEILLPGERNFTLLKILQNQYEL